MTTKVVHVLGNGDQAPLYEKEPRKGMKLLCNMPPFEVNSKEIFGTCMVDFKMMMALASGDVALDAYDWILGTRPRLWMYEQSNFYLKYAKNVKEFYTHVPTYAGNPTNFNCGHMAVHYAAARHKADEVHLYGFDTIFDFNMRSVTDLVLSSDRTQTNNYRLLNNWRPVWRDIFREFPKTKFVLHHNHDALKIPKLDNMEIKVYNSNLTKAQSKPDESDISDGRGMDQQTVTHDNLPLNRNERRRLAAIERKHGIKPTLRS
jgi:hypothetical protein